MEWPALTGTGTRLFVLLLHYTPSGTRANSEVIPKAVAAFRKGEGEEGSLVGRGGGRKGEGEEFSLAADWPWRLLKPIPLTVDTSSVFLALFVLFGVFVCLLVCLFVCFFLR